MKKYLSLSGAALCGAALLAAGLAAAYHFGDYVLLSPADQVDIMMQIQMYTQAVAEQAYNACKAGM